MLSSPAGALPSAGYGMAVEELAGRVADGLCGVGDMGPAAFVEQAGERQAALAAVRVLGPDVFAPFLLAAAPFTPADRQVVAEALGLFPPAASDQPEIVWTDRVTVELLARSEGGTAGAVESPAAQDEPCWSAWSQWMARVASTALPGLTGPVIDDAHQRSLDLCRGVTRSVLRRDYFTAARLVRWVALCRSRRGAHDLDVEPVIRHLRLWGGGHQRTRLHLEIATLVLGCAPLDPQVRAGHAVPPGEDLS